MALGLKESVEFPAVAVHCQAVCRGKGGRSNEDAVRGSAESRQEYDIVASITTAIAEQPDR